MNIDTTNISQKETIKRKKETKTIINGEITRVRKGNKRNNLPVILPENPTYLKQPNIITLMSSDFKTLQIRVLISLIEKLQGSIEESIKRVPFEQLSLFKEFNNNEKITFTIQYRDLGIEPNQYMEVKDALRKLASIQVDLDAKDPLTGADSWTVSGLFKPYIPKTTHCKTFTIEMERDIAKAFVNVDKGWTKFIKEIAFSSQSKYTVRIYMLISSWKDKGGFSITIDRFRKWLKLGDKYGKYKDIYKRIIKPVYDELFEKSNCWFEVSEVYKEGESEPYKLNFKIIKPALSKSEKDTLDVQVKNLENMMFLHLKMKDEHIQKVIPFITLSNYISAANKIVFLAGYVKENWKEIVDIPEYCTTSLISCLNSGAGFLGEFEEN